MREPTINEILRDYYYAIDSSRLNDDNIIIDENLKVEDSKNKYLQAFATFLNLSYWQGYRISESIISKLMGIIDYEGYEYQIIEQYIKILNSAMISHSEEIPVCVELSPQKCIEYINLYLETNGNGIPYWVYDEEIKIIYDVSLHTLVEVSDPISMIINDMKKWIVEQSKE